MPLQFEIHDAESGAFTYSGEAFGSLFEHCADLSESYAEGRMGEKPYLAALNRVLAQHPDFLNVHQDLAFHWHQQGKPKKALDAALAGLAETNRLIPEGFNGVIEWTHLENRAYLRTMHLALLSTMRLRRHKDAVQIIDQMLARNPNDNQGVRYLLGSEALRAGQFDRALSVLATDTASYPPNYYELALCYVLREDWVPAATALRRGFAANPYIAEMLEGNVDPVPLAIWHDTNFAEPDAADDYFEQSEALWGESPYGYTFVRWLFNHSKVLAERAAVMACKEALLWESDVNERSRILAQEAKLIAAIDDRISEAIVTKRMDQHGQLIWPWEAH